MFASLVLHSVDTFLELQRACCHLLSEDHVLEQNRLMRSMPVDKCRPTWQSFVDRTSSWHFKQMFAMMSLLVFELQCTKCRLDSYTTLVGVNFRLK